jgi:hypothetical protein
MPPPPKPESPRLPQPDPAHEEELERARADVHEQLVRLAARYVALRFTHPSATGLRLKGVRLSVAVAGGTTYVNVPLRVSRKIL